MFLKRVFRVGASVLLTCWIASSSTAGDGGCDIEGFPNVADPNNITIPWCPSDSGVQVHTIAVLAALQHCLVSMLDSSESGDSRTQREAMCEHLDQFASNSGSGSYCVCPDYMR